ncbi:MULTISPECIES: tRNA preQ1(34) S-adenosylmethionine ribosyltransferase-isomerase QueA [Staphylococcus]|jgi:S-adenosylmethionine:tRNA ribosyltransferase-isomerase|uniref:S-adenosylmethionine:tRNA ribosyltransferase-isomerase n=1 Tax=Staphylococcus hominis TaxID=1290 RepID=A0A8X8GPE2_STAHO|nr:MULTISPECIES: tRNA preQ1(34) S-adenosylmethionine ribosyltransferase-isomerase QueA [Staphylococcus]EUZ70548.1 S-adenosylmethionine:tRNA ribosyltransferase-isomerase [Staphylococcus sp. M0480]OFK82031.1 S-adenosylmethionine:tRNA ribosyltransferase-isomerase [Staphylococcus sp. HMSC057A02]OFM59134.1 S-adenosylmethionine:tRNA ribosyltransferase-isomerase [Staphylococcus sp. HMSC059G05]OFM61945.1 S-adenosylmethionine:tRNA ribosyltransferase-isomerase [Staphylococcus sp. HMSC062C01]OFM62335.1 S
MNVEEFDYHLPESLIAQTPLKNRDQSRLLVLGRKTGNIAHKHFTDIMDYFEPGDTLVLNDTRVMPARLFGLKEETGAKVEMLMLTRIEDNDWEVLLKPAKRIKVGNTLSFGNGKIIAECIKELEQGGRIMRLHYEGILEERLDELGEMPLPPYIKERLDDPDRYQTVYAKENGSAAAPTAGLHFTDELLQKIKDKGVNIAFITLHVGLGTFRPVSVEDIDDHEMHSEYYQMTKETADMLNKTKENGHRIISVGTTSTRTLETIRRDHEQFVATSGWTDIFIYPGFEYKAIDGLITNFHLPKSTLVMLVSAFSSREYILNAYKEAVKLKYRFFSFGDAMLII